jgi:hypothetical protein
MSPSVTILGSQKIPKKSTISTTITISYCKFFYYIGIEAGNKKSG